MGSDKCCKFLYFLLMLVCVADVGSVQSNSLTEAHNFIDGSSSSTPSLSPAALTAGRLGVGACTATSPTPINNLLAINSPPDCQILAISYKSPSASASNSVQARPPSSISSPSSLPTLPKPPPKLKPKLYSYSNSFEF